ncbi:hypothetical protein N7G274_005947 [Stereocaulon virgatum]|uniref:Uncharacterized protein n=1 Tax=Stereocaulon virgatum TaxID=373712 RepID=A0ABR4A8X1_9LECA
MADEPSFDDNILLARLNNLKKSNISLSTFPTPPTANTPSSIDDTPEDLIARFQKIQGRSPTRNGDKITAAAVAEDENGDEDASHAPPSPAIEELLAELGPEDQWTLDSSELKEAHELLAEAKRALPEQGATAAQELAQNQAFTTTTTTTTTASVEDNIKAPTAPPPPTKQENQTQNQNQEQSEEAEAEAAAASLQRILDDLELERQQEPDAPEPRPETAPPTLPSLVFPSTPDMALLSLDNLPSAPTTSPTSRGPRPKPKAKAKANAKQEEGFTDEQIDSWCTICCANAAVKCSGCDGDLYCWGCWREGHVGPDVGLEEKTHHWERIKGKRKV